MAAQTKDQEASMMHRFRTRTVVGVAAALVLTAAAAGVAVRLSSAPAVPGAAPEPAGGTGSYVLTATNAGPSSTPPFTGNGELGIRVPPAGQGYAGGTVPTQCELAGFYAQPPGGVQQRAAIPTWSTLTYSDGGEPFALSAGQNADWRQTLNLRTGVITTTARWSAPDGHVTDLSYQVLTDRALAHIGLVRVTLTPRWTGTAVVTDTIDGGPAALSTQVGKGWDPAARRDWVAVQALGTGLEVAVDSRLTVSDDVEATIAPVDQGSDRSVGQELSFPVIAGHSYTVTKYVGVESDGAASISAAQRDARGAASEGFATLLQANDAAWSSLWSGRIDVLGDPVLASEVNASEFYLWASTRDGVEWSISPTGLSSGGYNGHIFWDADTWMFPALLAQHPDLAVGVVDYRFNRLGAAEAHAAATGYGGGRFPWESALDGSEQIPPPASVFSEGLYEQHVTADVALAQWQYYEATGNKKWLAQQGWPVISAAAEFWASRAVAGSGDSYHVDGVTGPDEDNADVDDEVYTNAAAATTLLDAVRAARVLGLEAPTAWTRIASRMVVPTSPALEISQEFTGYDGQLIKQADATLVEFPLGYDLPPQVARNNVTYYAPRTDPDGPSMSDAINSIDTSASGTPGCASYVFTQRSVQPFVHDVFDQFSETRTGGVLTFMTGIGGFLQEFLYGYSGLRWSSASVQLAPSLTSQIQGVVLHDLSWHGRRFTVAIGQDDSTVTVVSGGVLSVTAGSRTYEVETGHSLTIPTRRPDLAATDDAVRCGQARASSSQPGFPPLAAVDGSPATGWEPVTTPATLTVSVTDGLHAVDQATLRWGQRWPPAPAPDVAPPPGPVTTLRATAYTLAVSADGTSWRTVASVEGRAAGTTDVLRFPPVKARYVKVTVASSASGQPPVLDELTVVGPEPSR